jgi:hypothetical protein
MAMACPQCNKVYEQSERICPTCSIQLLFYTRVGGTAPAPGVAGVEEPENQWPQTPWGKIIAGIVLAQGLAIGIKQLLAAGALAQGDGALGSFWMTLEGLATLHGLAAIGLIAGGMLAGAGQHKGMLYGSLVGLCSGFIFLFLERAPSELLPRAAVYVQPLVHLVIGALGGLVGKSIWKPTPRFALPVGKVSDIPLPPMFEMRWLDGPIHGWRVTAGATLAMCGAIWAGLLMRWMIHYSDGLLNVTTHFQARLVSSEIGAMLIMLGAVFAGATTANGIKQGLAVGLGGTVLLIGFQFANPNFNLDATLSSIITMIGLSLLGGWFGGELFPPVAAGARRRRIVDL